MTVVDEQADRKRDADERPVDVPAEHEAWRGVAAEDLDEVDHTTGVRLAARSRQLLGSLLRPHLRRAVFALLVVVIENLVNLTGPLLIATLIDVGVPAAIDGRPQTMFWLVIAYAACGIASSGLRALFLQVSGRIGQDVLLELRRRVFERAQRLSVAFHEKYTSGRMISRQTSDLDSLNDMLGMGLDGLFVSGLSVLTIGGVMLWLDLPLALIALGGFLPLLVLTTWFRRRSQRTYRQTRSTVAKAIVQFVETMNGIRAVQAFRRQNRNEAIMDSLDADYARANRSTLRLVAKYMATLRLVGNVSLAAVLAYGGWRVSSGSLELGTLAAFTLYLRRVLQPPGGPGGFPKSVPSAGGGAGENSRGVAEAGAGAGGQYAGDFSGVSGYHDPNPLGGDQPGGPPPPAPATAEPDTDRDGTPDASDSPPPVPGPASNRGCPLAKRFLGRCAAANTKRGSQRHDRIETFRITRVFHLAGGGIIRIGRHGRRDGAMGGGARRRPNNRDADEAKPRWAVVQVSKQKRGREQRFEQSGDDVHRP